MKRQRSRKPKLRKHQHAHAMRRHAERYGTAISPGYLADLIARIQAGEAKLLERTSNRTARYRIDDKIVCYDRKRQAITTFLHEEWLR